MTMFGRWNGEASVWLKSDGTEGNILSDVEMGPAKKRESNKLILVQQRRLYLLPLSLLPRQHGHPPLSSSLGTYWDPKSGGLSSFGS